jgi:SAM-dependent methyltransferase
MVDIKQEVQNFYDQVGWKLVSDDVYQNARFEDLRPVSREYIHNCHLRINRHLKSEGVFLLDAGSGPVQYPEYLEYSSGYQYRVCVDISIKAVSEARKRINERGLYVVADIANLPFKPGSFDGVVSLHTIHHLPEEEHLQAYSELQRVLATNSSAVIVNSWPESRLLDLFEPLIRGAYFLRHMLFRLEGREYIPPVDSPNGIEECPLNAYRRRKTIAPKGTFTSRHDVEWIKSEVGASMSVDILVWRSVSVRFLRALVHPHLGGRLWLRWLFWLEECFPRFFGENGKYPLIVIRKPLENEKNP